MGGEGERRGTGMEGREEKGRGRGEGRKGKGGGWMCPPQLRNPGYATGALLSPRLYIVCHNQLLFLLLYVGLPRVRLHNSNKLNNYWPTYIAIMTMQYEIL